MTVQTALQRGSRRLEQAGDPVPRLTSEVLLCHALARTREWLYAHGNEMVPEKALGAFEEFVDRRLDGAPTQYITGRQEFYGREFRVTPDVLIPRPETEHVIEAALERMDGVRRVVDVGCGSGAIAVTLALERPGLEVWGTDISAAALRVAADNARRLKARVRWAACDLVSAIAPAGFDLVVSNPPYVALRDMAGLQREVRDHEPHTALFAGETGLEVYRRLVHDARRVLRPGGALVMELGFRMADPVRGMLAGGWRDVQLTPDLAGIPRVISARPV